MLHVFVSAVVLFSLYGSASAADNHWLGTAGDNEWGTVANWEDGHVPDAVLWPTEEAEVGYTTVGAGPILGMTAIPIGPEETTGELEPRLAEMAGPLVNRVIEDLATGQAKPELQDDAAATLAPKIKKSLGAIDWTRSAHEVDCHIRAMQPWPKPFTFWLRPEGKPLRLVIRKVRPIDAHSAELPGTVLTDEDERLLVQTGTGVVEIVEIQPEGKRVMPAGDFLRGHAVPVGDRFGAGV